MYDRANRLMSLGTDVKLREEALRSIGQRVNTVLDAGCGTGRMSEAVMRILKPARLIMLDASRAMLETSREKIRLADHVLAVFEHLPFRHSSFDLTVMAFSFRDAMSYEKAVSQIKAALKSEGKLVIVDLGKPDSGITRELIGLYWRFAVPLIVRILLGRVAPLYRQLYRTYTRYITNRQLKSLLSSSFSEVRMKVRMMGSVVIALAGKPR